MATPIEIAADAAASLKKIAQLTDVMVFLANQFEIFALASERAAEAVERATQIAEQQARAAEAAHVATVRASGVEFSLHDCDACGEHAYIWQTFCLGCGMIFGPTDSGPQVDEPPVESGTYTAD